MEFQEQNPNGNGFNIFDNKEIKDNVGGIPGYLRIVLQRKALLALSGFLPGMHALHALHAHKQTHASRRPQAHHQAFGPRLAPRASSPLSFKGKAARMYRWDGKKGNDGAGGREASTKTGRRRVDRDG